MIERTREFLEAKQKAESADRAKTEFLANTSHEVRTPLNAILGMAEFLSEGDLQPEQATQVGTIISSGRSLMALLNDVIDLSKVEAGKLEIVNEPTSLNELVDELYVLWSPRADERGLSLKITCDEDIKGQFVLDQHRLRQCLSNLISNAIKFTAKGGVTVEITRTADQLRFAIQDTGPGINTAGLAKLFQPFEQVDQSITRKFGGTGLGLAIVKRLCELMEGTVGVTSQPGIGSRFTLTLPAIPATGDTPTTSQVSPAALDINLQGKRILLVEDNQVNRMVAKGHLKKFDVIIEEAENGQECLEQLAQSQFDLVLLDIHMPVMDGIETIKRIRQTTEPWHKIPVIALTADAMRDDRKRLLDLGMNGYASKPINRAALKHEIQSVLQP